MNHNRDGSVQETRRQLLKASALGVSSIPLSGCEKTISAVSELLESTIPESTLVSSSEEIHPDFHLLSRATYGVGPGDFEAISKAGREAWIEEQLAPEGIDDTLCDLRARRFESVHLSPGACYEFERTVLREELQRHTLLRAIYSKRQLFEVMVGFWNDHLNISVDKSQSIYFKSTDDREVIRKHALGNFRELIYASATSGAMLEYLDGQKNKVPEGSTERPNENYARELLELYTLGVNGGYTQKDVYEASKCLTGWHMYRKLFLWQKVSLKLGKVEFQPQNHIGGDKFILGKRIKGNSDTSDLEQMLDVICFHPSTAKHIATKLCQRFVSYDPPEQLINKVARVFLETGAEIKPMLREILTSKEFNEARGQLFKRPWRFVVSAIRAVGGDTHGQYPLLKHIRQMGQMPFEWPTPDGYPIEQELWMGGMVRRWDFALQLMGNHKSFVGVDIKKLENSVVVPAGLSKEAAVFAHFTGRIPNSSEARVISKIFASEVNQSSTSLENYIRLILASPVFQYS